MAKYVYVVFSDAVPGREDEFNTWYANTHVPDMVRASGFLHGQSFILAADQAGVPGRYLAIYEIETDDPTQTLAELRKLHGTSAMVMSGAHDDTKTVGAIYQAMQNPVRKRDLA